MEKVISLWSGGIDSTVMTYMLASKGFEVQPLHILIRNGSGKDFRERLSIDAIYEMCKDRYPNVRVPERLKLKIPPSKDRNAILLQTAKKVFPDAQLFAIGGYVTDNRFPEDNDYQALRQKTGLEVHTFDYYGVTTKDEIFNLGMELIGQEAMAKTWSCQLWFRKQCFERKTTGLCFSCKRIQTLRAKYFK